MPNTASAAKQARAGLRRRARNQVNKSQLRSVQKRFVATLAAGKKDEAQKMFPQLMSALDKAVKRGLIHRNAADRRKSRLYRHIKPAA